MPTLDTLLPLAAILSLGIFVQASAGFAAGLLIVPLLLWSGQAIPEAQTALLVATIPQNLAGVWSFRDHIQPREVALPAVLRIASLPVGVWILQNMEMLPTVRIRQVVGALVLAVTLAIMVFQPRPRHAIPSGWMWIAFTASGLLQGLVGMGGPAMVLWVQAHDWDTRRMRAFLFTMYLISMLPAFLFLYLAFGDRIWPAGVGAALLSPLLMGVTWLGLHTGTWLGRDRLRRVTLALLLLMGISGLCAPLLARSPAAVL